MLTTPPQPLDVPSSKLVECLSKVGHTVGFVNRSEIWSLIPGDHNFFKDNKSQAYFLFTNVVVTYLEMFRRP